MIMPMLQPALEQQLSHANATSVGGSNASSASTTQAVLSSSAGADAGTNDASQLMHGTESAGAHAAIEGLKHMQAGGDAQAARRGFQDALAAEYAKVQSEGEADNDAANAEALKRVMLEVSAGLVMPPS
jgi:hypothetical protein